MNNMSLFDLMMSGVTITNLDGSESNLDDIDTDGVDSGFSDDVDSDDVDVSEDSNGDEVIAAGEELDTDLLDVQEDQDEAEEVNEGVEEAEEAALATESLLANLLAAKALGGLSISHCELVHEHVQYIGGVLNMPENEVPGFEFGLESFSSASAVSLSTESVLGSVKDFFVKILDAILRGIAWIADKGKAMLSKLFGSYDKLTAYVAEIRKEIGRRGRTLSKEDTTEITSAGAVLAHTVEGKVVDTITAINLVNEVVAVVSKKWNVREVASNAIEKAAQSDKTAKEMAKAASSIVSATGESGSKTELLLTGKEVPALAALLPFWGAGKKLTASDREYGVKLLAGEEAYASKTLPRNKAILSLATVNKTSSHDGAVEAGKARTRMYSKLVSVKSAGSRETKLELLSLDKANQVLSTADTIISAMKSLKKSIDSTDTAVSKLKSTIWGLRKSYLAITKEQRDQRGFMANMRFIRNEIGIVKSMIGVLREPGTSLSVYVLHELKSLLDYTYKCVRQYKTVAEAKAASKKS